MMRTLFFHLLLILMLPIGQAQAATLFGPIPYQSFADSPFATESFDSFFLEDFEDGVLNTPGVSFVGPSLGGISVPIISVANSNSVDADDGLVDGDGSGGFSQQVVGTPPLVAFLFDPIELGSLPTAVGIVLTRSQVVTRFIASDPALNNSGVIDNIERALLQDASDDVFLGVVDPNGIAAIRISPAFQPGTSGLNVDHLQYGSISVMPIPLPPAGLLFTTALIALLACSGKRRISYQRETAE